MTYHQITSEERYTIAALRGEGLNYSQIARRLGRHRSTVSREVRRNSSRWDGSYRPSKAIERTNGRRSRSRRIGHFNSDDFDRVERKLREGWSPEQISGRMRLSRGRTISHETIYNYVWRNKERGGHLFRLLRAVGNGLLREYIPKRTSQKGLTQAHCDKIAKALNTRPRKRLGYRTPEECFLGI